MNVLVTGIAGFAGSHLAKRLVDEGHKVAGIAMPGESLKRLQPLGSGVETRFADIADAKSLSAALSGIEADYVFHLAAVASVPAAFAAPETAFRVNTLGTVNLLEAMRPARLKRFLYISSADVYGHVPPEALPLRETQTLRPASPYSASKAASEIIALQYWRAYALPVVILRPFNHTGPGQGFGFAPSDFAGAIARIERGLTSRKLSVGNLESYRDFTDVRDMVRAYALAARLCEAGEVYNISNGRSVRTGDVLKTLLGFSTAKIEMVPDPARQRPSDTPVVTGDHSKFSARTLWQPEIPLETTLRDLLNSYRAGV